MADANSLRNFLGAVFEEALAGAVLEAIKGGYEHLHDVLLTKDFSLLFKESHRRIFECALLEVAGDKTLLLREMIVAIKTDEGFQQLLLDFSLDESVPEEELLLKIFEKALPQETEAARTNYARVFIAELRNQIADDKKYFPRKTLQELGDMRKKLDGIEQKLDAILQKQDKKKVLRATAAPEFDSTPIDWRALESAFKEEMRFHEIAFIGAIGAGGNRLEKVEVERVYVKLAWQQRDVSEIYKYAGVKEGTIDRLQLINQLKACDDLVWRHLQKEDMRFEYERKELAQQILVAAAKALIQCARSHMTKAPHLLVEELSRSQKIDRQEAVRAFSHFARTTTLPVDLEIAVQQAREQLIIGDAGAGKTTFSRYLTIKCFEFLNGVSKPQSLGLGNEMPIPVYVRLEDFANKQHAAAELEQGSEGLLHFCCRYWNATTAAKNTLTPAQLRHQLAQKNLWLFLDGFDEIAETTTRSQLAGLIGAFAKEHAGVRLTVTSRPATTPEEIIQAMGLPEFRILELSDDQIKLFVPTFYNAQFPGDPKLAGRWAEKFLSDFAKSEAAKKLATTPLLLTVMVVVHYKADVLPRQRARLFKMSVEQVMAQRAAVHGKFATGTLNFRCGSVTWTTADQLDHLYDIAFQLHAREREGDTALTPPFVVELFKKGLDRRQKVNPVDLAQDFLRFCEQNLGLLVHRGGQYAFSHRAFQEYLAARWISTQDDDDKRRILFEVLLADPAYWQKVLRLFFAIMADPDGSRPKIREKLFQEMCEQQWPRTEKDFQHNRLEAFAGCLADMEEFGAMLPAHTDFVEKIEQRRQQFYEKNAPFLVCGKALSVIKEPSIDPAYPPLAFFKDGGEFTMGASKKDDNEAYDDEMPHPVRLSPFAIARYPVTNLQFADFIQARGYEDDHWWPDTKECRKFLEELRQKKTLYPSEWYNPEFGHDRTHAPVVGVSWYEAASYCNWWTQHYAEEWLQRHHDWFPGSAKVRMLLPTEAQWEFAARRNTGRKYPWGNESLSPQRLNYENTIKSTTEVGSYPQGATPEGTNEEKIFDLAGNVWEWCLDWYQEDFYKQCLTGSTSSPKPQPVIDPVCEKQGEYRVVRGGSWVDDDPRSYRAAGRGRGYPRSRGDGGGFRVVVVPQS